MTPQPAPARRGASWLLVFLPIVLGGVIAVSAQTASPAQPAPKTASKGTATQGKTDLFDEIYRRSEPMDATLKTIHAKFVETTTSPLLEKPLVAEGTLAAVRPSDVELTYTTPVRRTITIKGNQLIFDMPDRKMHQERDISEAQARIQRYFVTRKPDELRKHFTIVATEDQERPGTYKIDMTPKRKQIQEGLTRLELWIRRDTLMLDAMRMAFPGDQMKMMEFRDVEINKGE